MAEFTDLVGTAIANAQDRADLVESRARIVKAADNAGHRLERTEAWGGGWVVDRSSLGVGGCRISIE